MSRQISRSVVKADAGVRTRIKVWDGATRLFHAGLILLFGAMWWTGEQRMFEWHFRAAYMMIALILFRVIWGIAGSDTSRFATFVRSPLAVASYVRRSMFARGTATRPPGHNPLGGWSVILFLLILIGQIMLGLFAIDIDGIESGPLSYLVDFDTGRTAADLHAALFDLLLILTGVHVAAVAYYLVFKRDNLLRAMISGYRAWDGDTPPLRFQSAWRALGLFAISVAATLGLVNFLGG